MVQKNIQLKFVFKAHLMQYLYIFCTTLSIQPLHGQLPQAPQLSLKNSKPQIFFSHTQLNTIAQTHCCFFSTIAHLLFAPIGNQFFSHIFSWWTENPTLFIAQSGVLKQLGLKVFINMHPL